MVYRSLTDGKGASPRKPTWSRALQRHTFPDGKEFDSSYKRGQPTEFPLNRVIKCWTEGVQRMKVGGKAKLTCPPSLAYGDKGAGGAIPPNATLQFEVELLAIKPRDRPTRSAPALAWRRQHQGHSVRAGGEQRHRHNQVRSSRLYRLRGDARRSDSSSVADATTISGLYCYWDDGSCQTSGKRSNTRSDMMQRRSISGQ